MTQRRWVEIKVVGERLGYIGLITTSPPGSATPGVRIEIPMADELADRLAAEIHMGATLSPALEPEEPA